MIVFKDAEKRRDSGESVESAVREILDAVKRSGDEAVLGYTEKFDGYRPSAIRVETKTIKEAYSKVDAETVESLEFAAGRIEGFARRQRESLRELRYEISPGVVLGHRLIPVASCGCYVPAGRYPLPSSALMSIIPARVAGVGRIAAASPASAGVDGGRDGIHPAVLVAMDLAGVDEVYRMGGAQAIGAFAYGTRSVAGVDIVVGPGNKYVTEAKRQVSGAVGIDMLAGPSEAVIIADESVEPRWIAADALSRCEHDPNSWSILLLTSMELAKTVAAEIDNELQNLKTVELAGQTWKNNGKILVVDSLEEAADLSDAIAPEHLQVMTADSAGLAARLRNFGSLFVGRYAPVPFGDYVSGPNHILPTSGCARFSNGLNVNTFIKVSTFQEITVEGARFLSPRCARLAEIEGLYGHRRSAELRE
ncbi:MAG: histidinol dehydrogenase [Synergistaceae bacterium]|jgi:histidinol dehydrogenase/sulfopropanediol 3-dehydrogenase|nr:histidinol dehydrogenase [Synergistaceae bacterium]